MLSSQGSDGEDNTAGMALVRLAEDLGLWDHSCSKNCPNPSQPHSPSPLRLTLPQLAQRSRGGGVVTTLPFASSLAVRQVVHGLKYAPAEIVTLGKETCKTTNSTLFCVYAKKKKKENKKQTKTCITLGAEKQNQYST